MYQTVVKRSALIVFVASLLSACTTDGTTLSPPESSSVVVWKGFNLDWTYNHRLKELNSSANPNNSCDGLSNCTGGVIVASQRGEGPDSATVRHFFSLASETDNNITFFTAPGDQQIINGTENNRESLDHRQMIAIPTDKRGYDRYYVFFNGFNLRHNPSRSSEAENLIEYSLEIANPEFAGATNVSSLPVNVNGVLRMDTVTLEADTGNSLDYLLNLKYLIVGVNDSALADFNQHTAENSMAWNAPSIAALRGNPQPQDRELQYSTSGSTLFFDDRGSATIHDTDGILTGITGFSVDIATTGPRPSQHMLSLYIALKEEGTTTRRRSGQQIPPTYQAQADLFFKNWRIGMRRGSVAPFYDDFSIGEGGTAEMSLTIGKLEFVNNLQHHDTVNIANCSAPGTIDHLLNQPASPSVVAVNFTPTTPTCP
ncbi:MAG: hypothetical protein ACWA5L_02780 [bacterium]